MRTDTVVMECAHLSVVDGSKEVLLRPVETENKVVDDRLQPLPQLNGALHHQRYTHRNYHVKDQISRPHCIDHSYLCFGDERETGRQPSKKGEAAFASDDGNNPRFLSSDSTVTLVTILALASNDRNSSLYRIY